MLLQSCKKIISKKSMIFTTWILYTVYSPKRRFIKLLIYINLDTNENFHTKNILPLISKNKKINLQQNEMVKIFFASENILSFWHGNVFKNKCWRCCMFKCNWCFMYLWKIHFLLPLTARNPLNVWKILYLH